MLREHSGEQKRSRDLILRNSFLQNSHTSAMEKVWHNIVNISMGEHKENMIANKGNRTPVPLFNRQVLYLLSYVGENAHISPRSWSWATNSPLLRHVLHPTRSQLTAQLIALPETSKAEKL